MCSASVDGAQVPGGAVERTARRGAAPLRGSRWQRSARRDLPLSAGGWRLAPSGTGRVGRASHTTGRLPPALPPPHPTAGPQLHNAHALALARTKKQQALFIQSKFHTL